VWNVSCLQLKVRGTEYRTDMEPQEVIAKAARPVLQGAVALRRSYSVKRDDVVLMKDMSFWQLLTSLLTDRDEDKGLRL
jgi:hypothetical protein